MQGYRAGFARIYNERWAGFAEAVAPKILALYQRQPEHNPALPVLDLACGTGQLARHFLQAGYRVTGVDLSAAMLQYARGNCAEFVTNGQAHFSQGDMAELPLSGHFGLVVSTYDAVNHLPDVAALGRMVTAVSHNLVPGGLFVFDMNTRLGLKRWQAVNVQDDERLFLLNRGVYAADDNRAYTQITAFVPRADGLWERVEEIAYNTIFDIAAVANLLDQAGFTSHYPAIAADLATAVPDPEAESRVFFVATR